MAATFDPALSTKKDHVRLLLGDIHTEATVGNITNPLLQDEVILASISSYGYAGAVAFLADLLVVRISQQPTTYQETQGGIQVRWTDRVAGWKELSTRARRGEITAPGATRKPVRVLAAVQELTVQATMTDANSTYRGD